MPYYVYVSLSAEDRINVYAMDPETGALDSYAIVAAGAGPGPLCVDPQQRFLYAGLRGARQAAAFRLDKGSGRLAPLGAAPLGSDPCYLSTDASGRFLLTSYYRAGMAAVHPIRRDGSVGTPAVMNIKTAERAHSIQVDASNRFAFVPHTAGPNLIYQLRFDDKTGRLSSNPAERRLEPPPGEGPRHFCFHPAMDVVYFVNEQSSSVSAYELDTREGTLTRFQNVSTLPIGFEGDNTGAGDPHHSHRGVPLRLQPRPRFDRRLLRRRIDGGAGADQPPRPRSRPRAPSPSIPTAPTCWLSARAPASWPPTASTTRTGHLAPLDVLQVGNGPIWGPGPSIWAAAEPAARPRRTPSHLPLVARSRGPPVSRTGRIRARRCFPLTRLQRPGIHMCSYPGDGVELRPPALPLVVFVPRRRPRYSRKSWGERGSWGCRPWD